MGDKEKILALLAMATMFEGGQSAPRAERKIIDSDEVKKKHEDNLLQKGVQKYWYGDNYVLARSRKNADKKAKNKGYLNNDTL